jgi:hypothetical protein
LYPEGTELYCISLKLADPEYKMAIWVGRGNASDGIRRALEAAYKANPPAGLEPLNRFEMADRVKKGKAAERIAAIRSHVQAVSQPEPDTYPDMPLDEQLPELEDWEK